MVNIDTPEDLTIVGQFTLPGAFVSMLDLGVV